MLINIFYGLYHDYYYHADPYYIFLDYYHRPVCASRCHGVFADHNRYDPCVSHIAYPDYYYSAACLIHSFYFEQGYSGYCCWYVLP